MTLQTRLGVKADGLFGPVTANALADALCSGDISWTDPDVAEARQLSCDMRPRGTFMQKTLIKKMENDPRGPEGKLRWTDGGEWKLSNLRSITIPGVGDVVVYKRAIPAFICAFGEVRARLPHFKLSKVQTLCTRRMNWNLTSLPSLHSFGIAFDIDLDGDGKHERYEDLSEDVKLFIQIMESWGFTWGGTWTGKHADGMHFSYSL